MVIIEERDWHTTGYIDVGNETSINFVLHEPDDFAKAYALLIWPDGRHVRYDAFGDSDLRKMGLDLADFAAEVATMAILRKDDRNLAFKHQQIMKDPEAIALNMIARIITCGEDDPKSFILKIAEHLHRMAQSV
jgi:hypothetical protein